MRAFPFERAVGSICNRDKRYSPDAYLFLREVLDFTLKRVAESNGGEFRHVTGGEFCIGFRDLVIQRFGPESGTLMNEWGLRETSDIGEMVFNLIDEQIFGKQDSDKREDFAFVYNFDDAFVIPFRDNRQPPAADD